MNHASTDIMVRGLLGEDKTATNKMTERIVTSAAWTHNSSINVYGHSPLALIT